MDLNKNNPYIHNIILSEENAGDISPIKAYTCRIFYVLNGTIVVDIAGKTIVLEKHDLLLIPPDCMFRTQKRHKSQMIIMKFDFEWRKETRIEDDGIAPVEKFDKSRITHMPEDDIFYPYLHVTGIPEISPVLFSILNEFVLRKNYFREICSGKVKEIIGLIMRKTEGQTDTRRPFVVSEIFEYVEKNYSSKITNKNIAEELMYHPNHINRITKKYTGLSFHHYLLEYRLKVSCGFLTMTDLPICEVAMKCGFSSHSYYSSAFKSKYAMTPNEYRAENSNLQSRF